MSEQYFSIIADVEKSEFVIFHSSGNGRFRNGDVLAKYYHDIDGESKEIILAEYVEHLNGSLKDICLSYKWTTDVKTAPLHPLSDLVHYATRHKRDSAINDILIGK